MTGTPRRAFLKSALCAAAGLAASPIRLAAQAPRPAQLIDTHTHFYDPTRPGGVPWPPKDNPLLYRTVLPAEFRRLVEPLGVTGTVVVEASPLVEDNQWILDLAQDEPFIVGFVGNLQPGVPEFRQHLARFARNPLFRGIRNRGAEVRGLQADSPIVADYRRLAEAGLSLDLLGAADMLPHVAQVARLVPELRIVIDHLPFDPPRDPALRAPAEQALQELGRQPNVFAKISNVLRSIDGQVSTDAADYRTELDRLWGLFGPDRVVYGSNWPVSNRVAPYSDVLAVVRDYLGSKDRDAVDAFFWKNSQTAYGWQPRPA